MSQPAVEIFFSYAHKDEDLRDKLAKHLKLLERKGAIKAWHDRNITAGEEWKNTIDSHLESANIILLLISSDFLASDYCYDIEMKRAMERHDSNEAQVIPVILRAVNWHHSPFHKLTALPKDGLAITSWSNEDEAFTDVVERLIKVINTISAQESKIAVKDENKSFVIPDHQFHHENIINNFSFRDACGILQNFVKHENKEYSYLKVLKKTCTEENRSNKILSFAVRGEAGSGKSLIAESTYYYLYRLWNKNKTRKFKPYFSNLLWDAEKYFSVNDQSIIDDSLIDKEINKILNFYNRDEARAFIIVDGLDRYNQFSVKFLNKLTLVTDRFSFCNLIFFERIYSPIHDYKRAINDDRIVGIEQVLKEKFFVDLKEHNTKKISKLLAGRFKEISSTAYHVVEKSFVDTKEWYPKFNCLRLIHLYISEKNSANNPIVFLQGFVRVYIDRNLRGKSIKEIFENAETYSYHLLFHNTQENQNKLIPVNSKDIFSKRISTQSIPMQFYLAASYLLRTLFIKKDFSQENISKFEHIYISYFTQYARNIILNDSEYDQQDIILTIEQNYSKCGVKLQSFLIYLCGRFTSKRAIAKSKKFIKNEINNLQNRSSDDDSIFDRLMLERTLNISLIYLGGTSSQYIDKLMNDPRYDSINRWFHLVYYGDINYFEEKNNYFKNNVNFEDSSATPFVNTYHELSQHIIFSKSTEKHANDLAIYTIYSLALNRYQCKCLTDTVEKIDELNNLARQYVLQNNQVSSKIKEYVENCLQYLNSKELPILQSFFWILKLKEQKRNGWNNHKNPNIKRVVKDPESVLSHIGSAALLAHIFLPESYKNIQLSDSYNYEKYDKNEVIKLLLIHDIGEYDKGDIPKPMQSDEDIDNEEIAVKRLKIVPSPLNDPYWSNLSNPQLTVWEYWHKFRYHTNDVNVIIARDIDAFECLIQLECYIRDSENTIPDFDDFKSSLKKRIQTQIVNTLAETLLGDLF